MSLLDESLENMPHIMQKWAPLLEGVDSHREVLAALLEGQARYWNSNIRHMRGAYGLSSRLLARQITLQRMATPLNSRLCYR